MFLCGIDPDEVDAAVTELQEYGHGAGLPADVGREDDVTRLVDSACGALGGIDVLINNAGVAWREPFLRITPAHWDRVMTVNLRGMFLVAKAVARALVDQGGGGVIVNMSSTNGLGGEADYAHYNASKGGVLLLTRTMAVELGRYAIRVNALCPGFIETPLNAAISADLGGDEFASLYAGGNIPAGPSWPVIQGDSGIRLPGLGRRFVHHRRRDRHRRWATRGHVRRGLPKKNTVLEECAYHVGNAVLGIENRDPPPFVEGRARMRDAQADLVAGREPGLGGD